MKYLVDVGGSYEHIIHSVQQAEDEMGPTFLLMNCAGYAKAARFEEMPIEDVKVLTLYKNKNVENWI